jgi:tetratricopeptide (TPR) repeat protein
MKLNIDRIVVYRLRHRLKHRLRQAGSLLGFFVCSLAFSANAQTISPSPTESPMTTSAQTAVENFQNGQITRAVQQWNQEIRAGNDLIVNLFNRSQAYILLGQYDSALRDVNMIIALEGPAVETDVLLVQGIALSNLNKFSEALDSFGQVEQRSPSALVYSNRAVVYQRQGRLQEALADLSKAVELSPTAVNQLNLANLYIELGDFDQAVENMTQMIAADGNFFPAYLSRGIAHYHLEQYEEAVRDLLQTLTLSPHQAAARYYAGLSLAKLNYPEEAAQNLVMAADLYLQQDKADSYHQVLDIMAEMGL